MSVVTKFMECVITSQDIDLSLLATFQKQLPSRREAKKNKEKERQRERERETERETERERERERERQTDRQTDRQRDYNSKPIDRGIINYM